MMVTYILSVGYQQYRRLASHHKLCPTPRYFCTWWKKGHFHPAKSWWFQLFKACQWFVERVHVYKSSFSFHASFFMLFLCWGHHVGFYVCGGFLYIFLNYWTLYCCIGWQDGGRGSTHQKCEAENNLSAWALHFQEIISWTTTVFVNSFIPEIMIWVCFFLLPEPYLFFWVWC